MSNKPPAYSPYQQPIDAYPAFPPPVEPSPAANAAFSQSYPMNYNGNNQVYTSPYYSQPSQPYQAPYNVEAQQPQFEQHYAHQDYKPVFQDMSNRMKFMRKVYALLFILILFTTIVTCVCRFTPSINNWFRFNYLAMFWTGAIGVIIMMIAMMFVQQKDVSKTWIPLVLLVLFATLLVVAATAWIQSYAILNAFIVTCVLFVALSLFALNTKYDFGGWAHYLSAFSFMVLAIILVSIFLPFGVWWYGLISMLLVLLYGAMICYETNQIFKHYDDTQLIPAVAELYISFVYLFLAIVGCSGGR